jgi:CBS domain-containing protein
MRVREVMVANPIVVKANTSIIEAAKLMREHEIGSLIVVEEKAVKGIVTERDIVRRAVAEGKDVTSVPIQEIMTYPVTSISPEEDIVQAAHLMRTKEIRRLIVMEQGNLVGIVTTNDLLTNMKKNVDTLASMLYLIGRSWM